VVVSRVWWKSEKGAFFRLWVGQPETGRLPGRPPEECAMGKPTREGGCPHEGRAATLGELIHEAVHRAIELAVEEELTAALGSARYGRDAARGGYRNGRRTRTLTGPTGPLALTLPRATLFAASGAREWTSTLVPRYQRRLREVNEAVSQPTWPEATPGGCEGRWPRC
jgi:Transposase, Mutator family